jgi:hypothetical protein
MCLGTFSISCSMWLLKTSCKSSCKYVNEELRNMVANTLTQQVYHEKEIIDAIGNLTAEENKLSERMSPFEEKHGLNRERSLRMGGYCFFLMKDVDRLEDTLEAVVKG